MALRLKVKRVYTLTKDGFVAQDVDQEQKQAEIQERYQRYMERVKKEEAI